MMERFFRRLLTCSRCRFAIIILLVGIAGVFSYDIANANGRLVSQRTYLNCAAWQLVEKTEVFGFVVSEEMTEKLPFAEMARSFTTSLEDPEVIVSIRPLGNLKTRFNHGKILGSISDLKRLSFMLQAEPENRGAIEKEVMLVLASMRDSIKMSRREE